MTTQLTPIDLVMSSRTGRDDCLCFHRWLITAHLNANTENVCFLWANNICVSVLANYFCIFSVFWCSCGLILHIFLPTVVVATQTKGLPSCSTPTIPVCLFRWGSNYQFPPQDGGFPTLATPQQRAELPLPPQTCGLMQENRSLCW